MHLRSLTLAISAITLGSAPVFAAPSAFSDARSFAMGGVGVASSAPAAASFFNPALLAVKHSSARDDFGMILPSINVTAADEDDLIDSVDDIQERKLFDKFQQAVDAAKANPNSSTIQSAIDATNELNTELKKIDNKAMRVDFGLGMAFAIPGETYAGALFTDATGKAVIHTNYLDGALLDGILNDLNTSNTTALPNNADDLLKSEVVGVAAGVHEIGVSVATRFNVAGLPVAVGVSPKMMKLVSYRYTASANNFDEDDVEDSNYETTANKLNLDLGAAVMFGDQQQWTAGVSIRNLIPVDIRTVPTGAGAVSNKIKIEPNVKIGLAHKADLHTLAVDLDLTPNRAFSFESDAQFLAVGAEFDAWNWAQLRIGGRYNFASDVRDDGSRPTLTAGFGLSPFGVHLDLAAMANQTDVGAAAELGFTF